jgi:hypothetical protein
MEQARGQGVHQRDPKCNNGVLCRMCNRHSVHFTTKRGENSSMHGGNAKFEIDVVVCYVIGESLYVICLS